MFAKSAIKLDKDLIRRVKLLAEAKGFASIDDFIADVLERELERGNAEKTKETVVKKLKGLGYL